MSTDLLFSVFTPTYNRAHILHRVYESLLAQSFTNFEWLVVDDGSTDGTAGLIDQWQHSRATWFPIRYVWQPNGHKKSAHNTAVYEARGALLLPLDSDDRCVPQALERFAYHWQAIGLEAQPGFAGVTALCMDERGERVGDCFPGEHTFDSDALALRYRYAVTGEKWGFVRIDVLKLFLYPEQIDGHVPESVVWLQIATQYKTLFINEALRIYHQDPYEVTGQLSKTALGEAKPGYVYWKWVTLSVAMRYFGHRPVLLSLDAARLTRFYLHCTPSQRSVYWPRSVAGRLLTATMAPAGGLWWMADRLQMRKRAAANAGGRQHGHDRGR